MKIYKIEGWIAVQFAYVTIKMKMKQQNLNATADIISTLNALYHGFKEKWNVLYAKNKQIFKMIMNDFIQIDGNYQIINVI